VLKAHVIANWRNLWDTTTLCYTFAKEDTSLLYAEKQSRNPRGLIELPTRFNDVASDPTLATLLQKVNTLEAKQQTIDATFGGAVKVLRCGGNSITIGPQGIVIECAGTLTIRSDGDLRVLVGRNASISVGVSMEVTVGASMAVTAGNAIDVTAGNHMDVKAGKDLQIAAHDNTRIQTRKMDVTVNNLLITADTTINMKAGSDINLKASGDVAMKGRKVLQN